MNGGGRRAAWILGIPAVLLYGVALALIIGQHRDPALTPYEFWIEGTFSPPLILPVALVLVARRPDHRIAQLFAALVVAGSIQTTSGALATTLLQAGDGGVGPYLAWLHELAQMGLMVTLVLIVLLFPTGHVPTRRWRPVGWAIVVGAVLMFGAAALLPGALANFAWVTNPLAVDAAALEVLHDVGTWALIAGFAGAVLAPIARFRRASTTQRQQLKWFTFAVIAGAVFLLGVEPLLRGGEVVSAILWTVAPTGVVLALGLAVLRYRLYDIDRVVSRTVSYAIVTLVLAAIYVGGVVGVGSLVRGTTGGGGGDLVVAASTLAVAAAFLPLRARVQSLVDRRFNRARYDAQRTVEEFAQHLRDEVDLAALTEATERAAAEALAPRSVSVWLRSSELTR
jgi:hypothetical protein